MPLPSTPPISLSDLQTEFGGDTKASSYYRGGPYVPNTARNKAIPTAGPNSLSNYLDTGADVVSSRAIQVAFTDAVQAEVGFRIDRGGFLEYNTDGSWAIANTDQWVRPNNDYGGDYEVRFNTTAGVLDGAQSDVINAWVAVDDAPQWVLTNDVVGLTELSGELLFRLTATQEVVATAPVLLRAEVSVTPVVFLGDHTDDPLYAFGDPAVAGVRVDKEGRWLYTEDDALYALWIGEWITPQTTADYSTQYEVRLTNVQGDAPTSGPAVDTWVDVGTDPAWLWQAATPGTLLSCSADVEVRLAPGGALQGTGSFSVSVQNPPVFEAFTLDAGQSGNLTGFREAPGGFGDISPAEYLGADFDFFYHDIVGLEGFWPPNSVFMQLDGIFQQDSISTVVVDGPGWDNVTLRTADAVFSSSAAPASTWRWEGLAPTFFQNGGVYTVTINP